MRFKKYSTFMIAVLIGLFFFITFLTKINRTDPVWIDSEIIAYDCAKSKKVFHHQIQLKDGSKRYSFIKNSCLSDDVFVGQFKNKTFSIHLDDKEFYGLAAGDKKYFIRDIAKTTKLSRSGTSLVLSIFLFLLALRNWPRRDKST